MGTLGDDTPYLLSWPLRLTPETGRHPHSGLRDVADGVSYLKHWASDVAAGGVPSWAVGHSPSRRHAERHSRLARPPDVSVAGARAGSGVW